MHKLNPHRTGLALGSFVALMHLIWSLLLMLGWAQMLIDFKMAMHGIRVAYVLTDFSIGTAMALIIMTFVGGYIVGQIFAMIWNKVQK